MKILDPNDTTHNVTFLVRDHTEEDGYILEIRDEVKKTIVYKTLTATYNEDKGMLTGSFDFSVTEGSWYMMKIYPASFLTADTTLYTADSTVITADGSGAVSYQYQIYHGMMYVTAQTDLSKYQLLQDWATQPTEENVEFITP